MYLVRYAQELGGPRFVLLKQVGPDPRRLNADLRSQWRLASSSFVKQRVHPHRVGEIQGRDGLAAVVELEVVATPVVHRRQGGAKLEAGFGVLRPQGNGNLGQAI